jgi:hypothetical protein
MDKIKHILRSSGQVIRNQSQNYWRTLPTASYAKFLFAIFLIFSIIGYLNDIMAGGYFTGWQIAGNVFLSGVVAIAWVYSFTHNFKFLPLALLLFILSFYYTKLWPPTQSAPEFQHRLVIDSMGIMMHLILGYIFLIQFILNEGMQHVKLRTEMKLAKDLHDILVPIINFKNDNYEVYGQAIPTDDVGGDLIDITEDENSLTCYIADVSGHGVAAGLLMGMFKTCFHTNLKSNLSIADILSKCNTVLFELKKRSMFITCAGIRFFAENTADYSIAGHLPILHFNSNDSKMNHLSVKQIPITAKQNYRYTSKIVKVNRGDLFVLLTDGLVEVDNSDMDEFGIERIERLIVENIHLPLEDIFRKIISEINRYGQQRDDQTLLIVRRL